jgi:hypothetical protein
LTKEYRSLEEAREFVHILGLRNCEEWRKYCKSGQKPADIPPEPENYYKDQLRGMGDWLDTGYNSNQKRKYN